LPILKQKILFHCLLIFFLFTAVESQSKNLKKCERLTVAGAQSWYPYSYVKKGEKVYTGVLKESLKSVTDEQGILLKDWTELPWKRAEINLEKGNIDILLGAFHTPERAKKWVFSKPLANTELVLFSLKEIEDVNRLKQIYNKDISYPFGMATGKKFSAIKLKIQTEHIVHHAQIYGMLLKKHTDFGLLPKLAIETYLTEHKLKDEFKIHPVKLDSQNVYLVTAKNNPCLSKIKSVFKLL
jgi:polar amino acid transport system substrate-binding protein